MIATFYSYKGGVGRSMALANVAEVLAGFGLRVIACDWDLEAPGLEQYFFPEDEARVRRSDPGVIDLLLEYKGVMSQHPSDVGSDDDAAPVPAAAGTGDGEGPDQFKTLGRLRVRRPSGYAREVRPGAYGPRGWIKLLGAGRREGQAVNLYTEAVRGFDWSDFYQRWAGGSYIEFCRKDLNDAADVVLIDSRTGVTEHGGVCTHHLADLVLLFSATNAQNLNGTEWMAEILSGPKVQQFRGERRLGLLPVAARVEERSELGLLDEFVKTFESRFRYYVPESVGDRVEYLRGSRVPYVPMFSFHEKTLREFEDPRRIRLYEPYETIARSIVSWGVGAGLLDHSIEGLPGPEGTRSVSHAKGPAAGIFVIAHEPESAVEAEGLAAGLSRVGAQTWSWSSDPARGQFYPTAELLKALKSAGGYLILARSPSPTPWLQAEVNFALGALAADPKARAAVVLPPAGRDSRSWLLDRLPVVHRREGEGGEEAFFERLRNELTTAGGFKSEPPDVCPFHGPTPYDETEARLYAGRAPEVEEALLQMAGWYAEGRRWFNVTGPTGSGKSSFLRAGLVPAFLRGWVGRPGLRWEAVFAPRGADPVGAVESFLSRGDRPGPTNPSPDPEEIGRRLADLAPEDRALLLVVDPLESDADDTRVDFPSAYAGLARCLTAAGDRMAVLSTTRSHSAARLFPGFTPREKVLDHWQDYDLRPMTPDGVRGALVAPARLAGLSWEAGLVERVLADFRDGGNGPATLGALLPRIWDGRLGQTLTHKSYDGLGGLAGVIADAAGKALEGLKNDEQGRARKLLTGLVAADERGRPVRSAVGYEQALALADGGGAAVRLVERLCESLVLTVAGADEPAATGPQFETRLTHDALLDRVNAIREWVADDWDKILLKSRLNSAALAWASLGKPHWEVPVETLGGLKPRPEIPSPEFEELMAQQAGYREQAEKVQALKAESQSLRASSEEAALRQARLVRNVSKLEARLVEADQRKVVLEATLAEGRKRESRLRFIAWFLLVVALAAILILVLLISPGADKAVG